MLLLLLFFYWWASCVCKNAYSVSFKILLVIKDFVRSQGRRLKFQLKSQGSVEGIFSDLSVPFDKGNVGPSSVVAADMISVGDSWLSYAIKKAMIQSIDGVENQDWFKALSSSWKVRKKLFSYVFLFLCSVFNWVICWFLNDGIHAYFIFISFIWNVLKQQAQYSWDYLDVYF